MNKRKEFKQDIIGDFETFKNFWMTEVVFPKWNFIDPHFEPSEDLVILVKLITGKIPSNIMSIADGKASSLHIWVFILGVTHTFYEELRNQIKSDKILTSKIYLRLLWFCIQVPRRSSEKGLIRYFGDTLDQTKKK